jgi:hypothetical protein
MTRKRKARYRVRSIVYYIPSSLRLILVKGSLESLISSTTSVRVRIPGSIRVNFIICPGNHEGGTGRFGSTMCDSIVISVCRYYWFVANAPLRFWAVSVIRECGRAKFESYRHCFQRVPDLLFLQEGCMFK